MTNPLPPLLLMYSCVLVILERMTSHLPLRAKDYSSSKEKVDDIPPSLVQQPPSTSPPNGPLHLERPSLDTVLHPPPKGVVRKSAFNPHARVAQNYNIVEDMAQAPSVMSALEVLQIFPDQQEGTTKGYRWN
jgi:hypothetical protein